MFWLGGWAQYIQRIALKAFHALKPLVGVDRVAEAAVHLAPGLVEELLGQGTPDGTVPSRRVTDQHEELRVEPEPDLLAHLGDPSPPGDPLLPVGVIRVSPRWWDHTAPSRWRCRPRSAPGSAIRASRNGTMPASSHTSPTSGMRLTSSPHVSQRISTASIHGRWSSSSCSSPAITRSLELGELEPII